MSIKQLAKNVYSQWFLQLLRLAVGFITTVFVARILGPEGYGVVASIFVFSNLFGFAIDPGFKGSIVRYVSVYSVSGKNYIPIIAGFLAYRILMGSLLAVIFYVLAPYFAFMVNASKYVVAYQLFSISIFLSSIYSALRAYLRGIGRIDLASLYYSIGFVAGNMLSLIFVLSGFGVLGYISGLIIGDAIQFSIYMLTLKSLISKCIRVDFNEALKGLKVILPLSLTLLTSGLMNFLYNWFDRVLVLSLLGTYGLGLYSIALRFANVFDVVRLSIASALTPYYGNLYGANGVDALRPRIRRASKLISITYTPAVMVIAGLTSLLIPMVYGQNFTEAWPVATAHLVYLALTGFIMAYGGLAMIVEAKKEILMSSAVRALTSIALEIMFITLGLGALGVIIGKDLAMTASFTYLYLTLFNKLKLLPDKKSLVTSVLIGSFLMSIVISATLLSYVWTLPAALIIIIIIYVGSIRTFKLVDKGDVKVLKEALGTKASKIVSIVENVLDID